MEMKRYGLVIFFGEGDYRLMDADYTTAATMETDLDHETLAMVADQNEYILSDLFHPKQTKLKEGQGVEMRIVTGVYELKENGKNLQRERIIHIPEKWKWKEIEKRMNWWRDEWLGGY